MDFNELKQEAEKLCKELKDKAPADLSLLVLLLSAIINMMVTMFCSQELWSRIISKPLPFQTWNKLFQTCRKT